MQSDRPLGCSRCRYSASGCSRCRKSTFRPRTARWEGGNPGDVTAAAAPAPSQVHAATKSGKRKPQATDIAHAAMLEEPRHQKQRRQPRGSCAADPPPAGRQPDEQQPLLGRLLVQQAAEDTTKLASRLRSALRQTPAAPPHAAAGAAPAGAAVGATAAAAAGSMQAAAAHDPAVVPEPAHLPPQQQQVGTAAAADTAAAGDFGVMLQQRMKQQLAQGRHRLPLHAGKAATAGPVGSATAEPSGGSQAAAAQQQRSKRPRPQQQQDEEPPRKRSTPSPQQQQRKQSQQQLGERCTSAPSPSSTPALPAAAAAAAAAAGALSPETPAAASTLGNSPTPAPTPGRRRHRQQQQQQGATAHSPSAQRQPRAAQPYAHLFLPGCDPRLPVPGWVPPASPFGLLEEELWQQPWQLLLACMLLNKTSSKQVRAVLWSLLELCPTPEAALAADVGSIRAIIRPLGLHNKRAAAVQRLSHDFWHKQWSCPTELFGIGKYAADAYFMFCRGQWAGVAPDDKDLVRYHEWLRSTGGLGVGFAPDREQHPQPQPQPIAAVTPT